MCWPLLDGTHIHQSIPSNIITCFRGQKSYPTQSVLATGDSELRFTYIYITSWKSLAYDALILKNAFEKEDRLVIPKEYYVIL